MARTPRLPPPALRRAAGVAGPDFGQRVSSADPGAVRVI